MLLCQSDFLCCHIFAVKQAMDYSVFAKHKFISYMFLHAPTQNSKDLEKSTSSCDPKAEKPLGDPKSYRPISLLCVPFKIIERLIYACVETITDPLLAQEQAGFRHGRSAVDHRSPCWCRTSRIAFELKRRPELCLSTSQQPTTPSGTAASPASCCDCCLTDTWSTWSWR